MRTRRVLVLVVLGLAGGMVLGGCSGQAPESPATSTPGQSVIAPITVNVDDLRSGTVDLVVGQALNIKTGDVPVTAYSGEVTDPTVAEFVPGRDDGSAQFNPGVFALAPGSTEVRLAGGPDAALRFTVNVTARR